jgi:hypothetical protein
METQGRDETLRRLRREVETTPSAGAWSRLAAALARTGDATEAHEAASRALALDPRDPSRELIPPVWGCDHPDGSAYLSVPWRGLRQLAGARTLGNATPPRPFSPAMDIGQGFVLYDDGASLAALDVFSGEVPWKRPREQAQSVVVAGRSLFLVTCPDTSSFELVSLDVKTGTPSEPRSIKRAEGAPVHSPDDLKVIALDARTLAFLTEAPQATGGPAPRGLRSAGHGLLTYDLESHTVLGEVPLSDSSMLSVETAAGILLASAEDKHFLGAFDRTGKELWQIETEGVLLGVVDRQLLVGIHGRPWLLRAYTLEGRKTFEIPIAGKPERLLATSTVVLVSASAGEVLHGFSRRTLDPLYEHPLPGRGEFVATADAVLWLRPTPRSRAVGQVIAVDPTTREELSSLPIAQLQGLPAPLLVGGRLLLPSFVKGTTFVALEGA